jgi:CRP/FNR family cyclic AMP-dependent transcriptional regulator
VPELSFDDGATIFREGDPVGPVYLVERGMVRISKASPGGETVLGQVGTGGIFGEMALIDTSPRMATATAIGGAVCSVTEVVQMKRKLAMLGPEPIALYTEMIAYIRDMLPYEDRPPQVKALGETAADRAALRLVERLPDVISGMSHPPPVIVTLLRLFGAYIERRLPPSLVASRGAGAASTP